MSIPGISTKPTVTRVRVDASRCTGHAVCVEVAPRLFGLDRFGYAYVLPEAQRLLDADRAAGVLAREAAVRCPEDAIRVEQLAEPERPQRVEQVVAPAASTDAGPRLLLGAPRRETIDDWQGSSRPGLLDAVDAAGLRGAGGARYPVAAKWRSLAPGPVVIVANGAEREPGTIKDRYLLEHRPFTVLEGLAAVARTVGAVEAVVAVDVDSHEALASVRSALEAVRSARELGDLDVRIQTVPPRYVAGEETALLEVLDGRAPLPRVRPPHPTTHGLGGRPTVVHNVETLVQIALVGRHGEAWFRAAGTPDEPGTGIFSVSRFGGEATVHERPYGYPLRQLVEEAGLGGDVDAVIVGGWSGGLLGRDGLDVGLSDAELRPAGAALGTKAVQVLTRDQCVVRAATEVVAYFGEESARQCPPCYEGLPWIAGVLARIEGGEGSPEDLSAVEEFARSLPRRGACALPDGAARFLASVLEHAADSVQRHLAEGCPHRQEAPE